MTHGKITRVVSPNRWWINIVVVTLVSIVGLIGVTVWQLKENVWFSKIIDYADQKIYQVGRLTSTEVVPKETLIENHKPYLERSSYQLPANITVSADFYPDEKKQIVDTIFEIQKVLPVDKIGPVNLVVFDPGVFSFPLIFPDSGVAYISVTKGMIANGAVIIRTGVDIDHVPFFTRRAILTLFANRVMSDSDRLRWLQLRRMGLPEFLNEHWDYQINLDRLSFDLLPFSPIEDFNQVFIRLYLDHSQAITTTASHMVTPAEKLFILGQISKLLVANNSDTSEQGFVVDAATVSQLKNKLDFPLFLPTKTTPNCQFDNQLIKEDYFVSTCTISLAHPFKQVSVAVYRDWAVVEGVLGVIIDSSQKELVELPSGMRVYRMKKISAVDSAYETLYNADDHLFYFPEDTKAVVEVSYSDPTGRVTPEVAKLVMSSIKSL